MNTRKRLEAVYSDVGSHVCVNLLNCHRRLAQAHQLTIEPSSARMLRCSSDRRLHPPLRSRKTLYLVGSTSEHEWGHASSSRYSSAVRMYMQGGRQRHAGGCVQLHIRTTSVRGPCSFSKARALLRPTKGCILPLLELHCAPCQEQPGLANHQHSSACFIVSLTTPEAHRMRDSGIDLPDGPYRVRWRLNLRRAVAAVYNMAGAIEDYGIIQSPVARNYRDTALRPHPGVSA